MNTITSDDFDEAKEVLSDHIHTTHHERLTGSTALMLTAYGFSLPETTDIVNDFENKTRKAVESFEETLAEIANEVLDAHAAECLTITDQR